jgi:hypothetical protein
MSVQNAARQCSSRLAFEPVVCVRHEAESQDTMQPKLPTLTMQEARNPRSVGDPTGRPHQLPAKKSEFSILAAFGLY